MAVDLNKGIQMEQEQPTKIIMMISNWIKPFGLHGLHENIPTL